MKVVQQRPTFQVWLARRPKATYALISNALERPHGRGQLGLIRRPYKFGDDKFCARIHISHDRPQCGHRGDRNSRFSDNLHSHS
jgi:hypothetical protein